MAPVKSIRLSIPSSSNSLKLIVFSFSATMSLNGSGNYPGNNIRSEKNNDTSISPIAFGNFRNL